MGHRLVGAIVAVASKVGDFFPGEIRGEGASSAAAAAVIWLATGIGLARQLGVPNGPNADD